MKKLLALSLISLTSFSYFSSLAFADDVNAANTPTNQIYLGIEGGGADTGFNLNNYKNYVSSNNPGETQSYTLTNNNFYGDIHAGILFPVADVISMGGQLGYQQFGTHSAETSANDGTTYLSSKESEKISDFNAKAVIQTVYNNFFASLNTGLGYFMIKNSGEITDFSNGMPGVTTPAPESKNSVHILAGAELGYNFSEHFNTYISYEHVFGTDTHGDFSNKVPTMDTLGLGVNYIF